jgi:hypothetical protein
MNQVKNRNFLSGKTDVELIRHGEMPVNAG